jgi:hypothetical protein
MSESGNEPAEPVDGSDVEAIQHDDSLIQADRVDLIANQVVPEDQTEEPSGADEAD